MNRFRLLAIGTTLIVALTTQAQLTAAADDNDQAQPSAKVRMPTAEDQLKFLTGKLDLTGDQESRIKPILQELNDVTQRFIQDKSMSGEKRLENVRAWRYRADKQIREILSDGQKQKLDQVEREPHGVLHGDVNAATPPPLQK